MTGRLRDAAIADVYTVGADDGSLQFAIPQQVVGVRIDGAGSARFERVDLPMVVTIAVVSLADEVA